MTLATGFVKKYFACCLLESSATSLREELTKWHIIREDVCQFAVLNPVEEHAFNRRILPTPSVKGLFHSLAPKIDLHRSAIEELTLHVSSTCMKQEKKTKTKA